MWVGGGGGGGAGGGVEARRGGADHHLQCEGSDSSGRRGAASIGWRVGGAGMGGVLSNFRCACCFRTRKLRARSSGRVEEQLVD